MNDDRIAYGKGIGMTRTVAFMVGSGLNGGGPQYSHFMACLIIMSWKDASFSNLSCLAKSSPRTLSFFFFFILHPIAEKIRFVSKQSLKGARPSRLGARRGTYLVR